MKRLPILIAALALSVTGVRAAIDPTPDGLGIYFEETASSNCKTASAGATVRAYLVATNITASSGISGWECRILDNVDVSGGVYYRIPTTTSFYVNVLNPPMFMVGFQRPVPRAACITLMRLDVFLGSGTRVMLGLAPSSPSSFGDLSPGYAVGDYPGTLIPLTPSSNVPWPGVPHGFIVAGINAGPNCPVTGEHESWGGVKTLFR